MKKKVLVKCPVCGGNLKVVEYKCAKCGTTIRGEFDACALCNLNDEEMKFLKFFLLSYGNISLVARRFGISHPTAKLRIRQIINKLGWESEEKISPQEVLEMLDSGEISVEEGLRLLKEGKNEQ